MVAALPKWTIQNALSYKAARAALQKCSQDSSKICRDASGEWQVARTLTKDKASIYHNEEEVYKQMGDRTFQRIHKRHLRQFKKARSSSDMCQHCVDYDDKVLPMMNKTLAEQRQQLEELLPHYFNAWDTYIFHPQMLWTGQLSIWKSWSIMWRIMKTDNHAPNTEAQRTLVGSTIFATVRVASHKGDVWTSIAWKQLVPWNSAPC